MLSQVGLTTAPVFGSQNGKKSNDDTLQTRKAVLSFKQVRDDRSRLNHSYQEGDVLNNLQPNGSKTDKDILDLIAVISLSIKFPGYATLSRSLLEDDN